MDRTSPRLACLFLQGMDCIDSENGSRLLPGAAAEDGDGTLHCWDEKRRHYTECKSQIDVNQLHLTCRLFSCHAHLHGQLPNPGIKQCF